MINEAIQIIDCQTVRECCKHNITEEMVGRKAIGLINIPYAWRLPFFVIHQDVADNYIKQTAWERKKFIKIISNRIKVCVDQWDYAETEHIIIRSSGKEEGMNERGKYDSEDCLVSKIDQTIEKLFNALIHEECDAIAYIVQPFVEREKYGHLSNERRVSRAARDWKYEFEESNSEVHSLGIRYWRVAHDITKIKSEPLKCIQLNQIKETLRKVAYYYTAEANKSRKHLEFVWNGEQIFLVQNDVEQPRENAENPIKECIEVKNIENLDSLKIFREVDINVESEYPKIKNVMKYAELGLPTVPFYAITDKKIIEGLTNNVVSKDLKKDIELLTSYSIVVRTDVSIYEEDADRQLLPRSNEIRSFEDFMKWASSRLLELMRYENIVLLVHVFVPAISAAFAYAEPNNRIVTIQSLWGLPEGLYYNTHDTTQVDTGSRYISHIDKNNPVEIKQYSAYKAFYYAPNNSGIWEEKIPKSPYDWKMSITKKQAKYIAWGSRLIAQREKKSLSIMWFVGVDGNYYHSDCLPWYDEEVLENTFSHEVYQKKYYTQREVQIRSREDLDEIRDAGKIGALTIHPQNDIVLRDRNFLKTIGDFAKQNNITVFLDGTVLAHPVYRLMSQGVKIVLTKSERMLFDREQFNKLVRDKIPDKIQNNMENVWCFTVRKEWLLRYLKEKLVEEVYEVLDAKCSQEILEELSDVYEVVNTIRESVSKGTYYIINREKKIPIIEPTKLIRKIEVDSLLNKVEKNLCSTNYFIEFYLERNQQEIELELRFSPKSRENAEYIESDSKLLPEMLCIAYQLLNENRMDKVFELCSEMEKKIADGCRQLNETMEKIIEIGKEKCKKNGGFQKGYVLKETSKSFTRKRVLDNAGMEVNDDSMYPELHELLFNPVIYTDYRETDQKELLIRIKYPLCFEKWYNKLSGKAVKKMFGLFYKLYIIAERIGGKYIFSIYLDEDYYQQLKFEL